MSTLFRLQGQMHCSLRVATAELPTIIRWQRVAMSILRYRHKYPIHVPEWQEALGARIAWWDKIAARKRARNAG